MVCTCGPSAAGRAGPRGRSHCARRKARPLFAARRARHGTAQHGTARHGTARHGTARYGTARHGTARGKSAGLDTGEAHGAIVTENLSGLPKMSVRQSTCAVRVGRGSAGCAAIWGVVQRRWVGSLAARPKATATARTDTVASSDPRASQKRQKKRAKHKQRRRERDMPRSAGPTGPPTLAPSSRSLHEQKFGKSGLSSAQNPAATPRVCDA